MLIVIINSNLTIDAGVLVTPRARKRGFLLFVRNELINNGIISMTARGANAVGQNVYLWKSVNDVFEVVPAIGGAGAAGQTDGTIIGGVASWAPNGIDGVSRRSGGGGAGASRTNWPNVGGSGATGGTGDVSIHRGRSSCHGSDAAPGRHL